MEQQTDLSDVPVLLSLTTCFSVSPSSEECSQQDEDPEDDYDEGPDDGPEADRVSARLQIQA